MNQDQINRQLAELCGTSLSRREALRRTLLGAAGLLVANKMPSPAFAAPAKPAITSAGKAKSVIQILMWGGPCHIDTFDPKPNAGSDYTGPLKTAIDTNVKGIKIGESLPMLAKQADKYSLIRSMTHHNNSHETAAYMVQTGHKAGDGQSYPCTGAVVSLFKGYDAGYKGLIPPYIVLTEPQGRFSEAGFLGNKFKPFATGGDPSQSKFTVEGVVAQGITEKRQHNRRELLKNIDSLALAMPDSPTVVATAKADEQAYELILGDAGKVFDPTVEKDDLRDRYGKTKFGQSCLVARRLIEKGVPYVTINFQGWDSHKQHFETMRRKLPEFDKGLATLLQDLHDRGLLDTTIVAAYGEFGRTPKVQWEAPWNGGRGHYGNVFSAFVAGGGFKGGHVVGSSNDRGEEVKDRPVYPVDLIGSFYTLLGVDLAANLPHPQGLPVRVLPEPTTDMKSAGLLTEIM